MCAGQQNSELLTITYGALVAQLVEDYEDPAAINEQLEKMCATAQVLRCIDALAPVCRVAGIGLRGLKAKLILALLRQGLQHRYENH